MLMDYYYISLREVLSVQKDPDIDVTMYLILLIGSTSYMLSASVCLTYHVYTEELCFVIRNLWNMKGKHFDTPLLICDNTVMVMILLISLLPNG